MVRLRVCVGDREPVDYQVEHADVAAVGIHNFLCDLLNLPATDAGIEVYYHEQGQAPDRTPVPRGGSSALAFSGTYQVKQAAAPPLERRPPAATPSAVPPCTQTWQAADQTWDTCINVANHAPVAVLLGEARGRVLHMRATTQRAPADRSAAPPELRGSYFVSKCHFQLAMRRELLNANPDGAHIKLDARSAGSGMGGNIAAMQKLLKYMVAGNVVLQVESFWAGQNLLLLAEPGDEQGGGPELHGYVMDAGFASAAAERQLRMLQDDPTQMFAVLDIDHTIIQTYTNKTDGLEDYMLPPVPLSPGTVYQAVAVKHRRSMPPKKSIDFWFSDTKGTTYHVAVRDDIHKVLQLASNRLYKIRFLTTGLQDYGERMLQALQLHLRANPHPHYKHLQPMVDIVFCRDNVVSVSTLNELWFTNNIPLWLPHWGPKSFKQHFVLASFPELCNRWVVGVDDRVVDLFEHHGCSKSISNYDPDSSPQVLRIPRMKHTASAVRDSTQPLSWHRMYIDLVEVHRCVTAKECSVREAVDMCFK